MKRRGLIFLLLGIILGIGGAKWYVTAFDNTSTTTQSPARFNNPKPPIPTKVLEILHYVETFHEPKKGYLGGAVYQNYDGRLPVLSALGDTIVYRKWNLNSKQVISDQAILITGNDHSAWYADNLCKKINRIK